VGRSKVAKRDRSNNVVRDGTLNRHSLELITHVRAALPSGGESNSRWRCFSTTNGKQVGKSTEAFPLPANAKNNAKCQPLIQAKWPPCRGGHFPKRSLV
jgi:hypothetical protein